MPHMSRDKISLPGMKHWNGVPLYECLRIWLFELSAALGTVIREGKTLLERAEKRDTDRYDEDNR